MFGWVVGYLTTKLGGGGGAAILGITQQNEYFLIDREQTHNLNTQRKKPLEYFYKNLLLRLKRYNFSGCLILDIQV